MMELFKFNYSSSRVPRQEENATFNYLSDYIQEVANGAIEYASSNERMVKITCADILEFLTGGTHIPVGSFTKKIDVFFYDRTDSHAEQSFGRLPSASTCGLLFYIPRQSETFDKFKTILSFAIMESKNYFGRA